MTNPVTDPVTDPVDTMRSDALDSYRMAEVDGCQSTFSIPNPERWALSLLRRARMVSLEGSLSPHPQSPFTLALGVTTPSQPGGRSSYGCHTRAVSAWDRWPLFWKYAL